MFKQEILRRDSAQKLRKKKNNDLIQILVDFVTQVIENDKPSLLKMKKPYVIV